MTEKSLSQVATHLISEDGAPKAGPSKMTIVIRQVWTHPPTYVCFQHTPCIPSMVSVKMYLLKYMLYTFFWCEFGLQSGQDNKTQEAV